MFQDKTFFLSIRDNVLLFKCGAIYAIGLFLRLFCIMQIGVLRVWRIFDVDRGVSSCKLSNWYFSLWVINTSLYGSTLRLQHFRSVQTKQRLTNCYITNIKWLFCKTNLLAPVEAEISGKYILLFFFYLISASVSTPCRWDQFTVFHLVAKEFYWSRSTKNPLLFTGLLS